MTAEITTISSARPEHLSMDFERLRAEGIRYLEQWAPYSWTDFNIHDPGITILEVLCYAITDLGYRTQLPLEDLLASGPRPAGKPYFLAEEILPMQPVTENDYRKLLIDLPGVKNAWLEKADPTAPYVFIQRRQHSRGAHPDIAEFLEDVDNPDVDFPLFPNFHELVLAISDSEVLDEATADQLGQHVLKIATAPHLFNQEDLTAIRDITAGVSDADLRALLEKLTERLTVFHDLFHATFRAYELHFRLAEREDIQALIDELRLEEAMLEEVQKLLRKLAQTGDPREDALFSMDDLTALWQLMDLLALDQPDAARQLLQLSHSLICRYGYHALWQSQTKELPDEKQAEGYELLHLNGLYNILLDLHDPTIEPDSKAARRIIRQVRNRYHQYRNLCEDLVKVEIVEIQEICLCLDIEIDPTEDAREIMAEVLFRLQDFLTPTIRFHSLGQLLERGLCGDEIYNGPRLTNGFIMDDELERATLPSAVFHSDLYRIVLNTPGVRHIRELAIKNKGDETYDADLNCLPLHGRKPLIDPCCSCLHVSRDGFTTKLKGKEIDSLIKLKQLAARNLVGDPGGRLSVPTGQSREDLSEYVSVQYEFPHNYAIGDEELPTESSALRRAQTRQLQAYLLFFDQLMADYLVQLSQVGKLLSVDQDAAAATYFYQALYEVPGVRELIFQPLAITEEKLTGLAEQLDEEVLELLQPLKGRGFSTFAEWHTTLAEALGDWWNQADIQNLLIGAFRQEVTDGDWRAFIEEDDNYFIQQLRLLTEDADTRQARKNRLLDHLLARFGEVFTDYSLQQFQIDQELTGYDDYGDYLTAKRDYLLDLPQLGSPRARAYNYRQFIGGSDGLTDSDTEGAPIAVRPDVWNTTNVAGLKQRVYRLLNMGEATTESVFCDPRFRIDLVEDENADRPRYYIQLVELDDNNRVREVLLVSKRTYTISQARARKRQLDENIGGAEAFAVVQDSEDDLAYRVTYKNESDGTVLESRSLSRSQANTLRDKIGELVDPAGCRKEGFHLLEHILLRPVIRNDQLMPLRYSCHTCAEPLDPYSFWLTVVVPGWTERFGDPAFRRYFEHVFRRETPAHIAVCFRWVEEEDRLWMRRFEDAFEQWREAKARCEPDNCDVAEHADRLIDLLDAIPCACYCAGEEPADKLCDCEPDTPAEPVLQ